MSDVVKKYEELVEKIQEIMPGATIDEDNYGQLVIYTRLQKFGYEGDLTEWSESSDSWSSSNWC